MHYVLSLVFEAFAQTAAAGTTNEYTVSLQVRSPCALMNLSSHRSCPDRAVCVQGPQAEGVSLRVLVTE